MASMVGSTLSAAMGVVTESATSTTILQLVGKVFEYADMFQAPNAGSVKVEAEKLQRKLPQIRAILTAVQGTQIKQRDPDFDARLWQFRDALEAADGVLDEIKYHELEEKVNARDSEVSGSLSGRKRKLFDFVKNAFVGDGVLNKLREAVKGLEAIASDVGPFLELANGLIEQFAVNDIRDTDSITESMVVGREKEKVTIVEWLTAPAHGEEQGFLSIFSIIGMGGMGKTTLAQFVLNDQRVAENFELVLWVCVSDNSGKIDPKKIIKKIIEEIIKQNCDLDNLNTLQRTLKEKLTYKRFLLVLDDVWRDDTLPEWEKIVAPLRFGDKGSKILLTSRMESVAKMIHGVMEGQNKYMYLGGLEENDFMTLLNRHAYVDADPNKYKHLHKIGNEIAKKLWACPLAAKVIGGVLNKSLSLEFWNKILNEDILNIEESKDYMMEILKLSYYHMPTHLQICFRYCSIFPQDYRMDKEELVKLWMCSGLIPHYEHEERKLEDVANGYLNQLIRKSFFNVYDSRYYFIHDLLHDLARCVSEGECLRIAFNDEVAIPRTIRHLSIEIDNYCILKEICNLKKLQTLMITGIKHKFDAEQELNDILSKVKNLRVLWFNVGKVQRIQSTIGDLIHLRYLKLKFAWASSEQFLCFMQSLCRLYHLRVMQVKQTDEFSIWNIQESDMECMINLINMKYLELPNNAICKVPWIGKMHSLRELHNFEVRNESSSKIGELRCLNDLQELSVHGLKNITNPVDAIEAKMNEKKNLKLLELNWSNFWSHVTIEVRERDAVVADNLKPPSSLTKLEISYYCGIRSPCWMSDSSYHNLKYVKLTGCYQWEHLPPLGQLHSLESLHLIQMSAIKQVGCSLYGGSGDCIFPSLKEIEFYEMPKLEEWIGVQNKLFFPRLESVSIENCPELKRLPTMPPSVRSLLINDAALDTIPGFYQAHGDSISGTSSIPLTPSLAHLKVWNCPNIITLDVCQLLQPESSHTLKEISIRGCRNLLHISVAFLTLLAQLSSLKNLTVKDCPKLVTREIQLPTMLQDLGFGSCGGLDSSFIRSLQDLSCLTTLKMDGCANIQSISPTVFSRLITLHCLEIRRCKELASLSGIEELIALRSLTIHECEKLNKLSLLQPQPELSHHSQVNTARHNLKLDELKIDNNLLLLLEPLRSLRFTRSLRIRDPQMISLPEQWLLQNRFSLETLDISIPSLVYLPSSLESMNAMQYLFIWGAKLLRSLPNLPASLEFLHILDCNPELEVLCRMETGLYWPMISHIPGLAIF